MLKWGTDYFIKCHTGKNELYVQVGDGSIDHGFWYPPEYINYKYPSFKIDASGPGSEVAAETVAEEVEDKAEEVDAAATEAAAETVAE